MARLEKAMKRNIVWWDIRTTTSPQLYQDHYAPRFAPLLPTRIHKALELLFSILHWSWSLLSRLPTSK